MEAPPVDKRRIPGVESSARVKSEKQPLLHDSNARGVHSRDAQPANRKALPPRQSHRTQGDRGVVQQARSLQRAAGNQAIQRMFDEMDAPAPTSREPPRLDAQRDSSMAQLTPLRSSPANDALEQEAGRLGDLVARAPSSASLRALSAAISACPGGVSPGAMTALPPGVREALRSPSERLDPAVLRGIPQELAAVLSDVRIHVNGEAARSADALGAEAYTVGGDIVFGEGRFAPHTSAGRGLIAHEATHVRQQAAGTMTGRVQAQSKGDAPSAPKVKNVKIRIPRAMSADEIAEEFARQRYGASRAELTKTIGWFSINRGTTDKEVKQGWATIQVPAGLDSQYDTLDPEEKKKVDAEVDRRFAERTGRDPSTLAGTPVDKGLALQKEHMREELMWQRAEIDQLPDDIRKVLFAGDAKDKPVSPEDFTQLLRIARKLAQLPPEQRKDYSSRVNAETTSLDTMESSVDSYVAFQKRRETEARQNEEAAKPLLGSEDVYALYKQWKARRANVAFAKGMRGAAKSKSDADDSIAVLTEQLAEAETALLAALKKKNFNSIAEFEAAIESYRVAFRTQAVNLALDLLARYEHMLFEERKKYQGSAAGTVLSQGIASTDASKLYAEAHSEERQSFLAQMGSDPMEKGPNKARDQREIRKHQDAARSARARAEAEVIRGSGKDPIVAGRGIDREKLSGLGAGGARAYMLETIDARATDASKARQEFVEDPDRVFRLDDLINVSFKLQDIENDSVYGAIIRDYIAEEARKHLLSQLAIGVLALALALLVPGGGWIAAAALVASAGISTFQALEAIEEYQSGTRAYNLGFIQDEPSLIWVGVAVVAAAVDIGAATHAVVAASKVLADSAKGLSALEGPLRAFAKGEETAESLLKQIETVEGLQAEVRAAMARELKASEAAKSATREAWQAVAGRTNAFLPGAVDPGTVEQAFRALYYSVRRHVDTITKLRKDAKLVEALGDITRMTGAERSELETAFEEVKQLVKAGDSKKMDEEALLGFVDRWSINRGTPGFKQKLLDEMKVWKPLTAEQKQALTALEEKKDLLKTLFSEKREHLAELFDLRAKLKDPAMRSAANASRVRELEKELNALDPSILKPGASPAFGEIAKTESNLAKLEEEARKSQLSLYDRLRSAAPGERARDAALKGVAGDQIGKLKTPPQPLQAEHIVSVREVSDMDGFKDLAWSDQKAIVDMKENLVAMDGAANASKGDRTWTTWPLASRFYEPDTIAKMVEREARVRTAIQEAITARLPKTPVGKP